MPKQMIRSSEINILTHLMSHEEMLVIVYGSDRELVVDDNSSFLLIRFSAELEEVCQLKNTQPVCIFNLSDQILDITGAEFIVEWKSAESYPGKKRTTLNYICNADGSYRWLFPKGMREPWFLSLYNFSYWKATIYKLVCRIAFFFHLSKFLSDGRIYIHSNEFPFFQLLAGWEVVKRRSYSIFTGTQGPNRKIIMALADQSGVTDFYKIGLNERSRSNIYNEYMTLEALAGVRLDKIVVPKAALLNNNIIRVENIKPVNIFTEYLFGGRQAQFLNAIYQSGNSRKKFRELPFCASNRERLVRIKNHLRFDENPYFRDLYKKLVVLQNFLESRNDMLPVSRSHGDFTRWNMYQDNRSIYVYDWELSKPDMPMLLDMFHYVIQVAIFSVHADFAELDRRVANALNMEPVKDIIAQYAIDPLLHLQMYLLENTGYYLELYLDQPVQHKEMQWQFKAWDYLLFTHTPFSDGQSHRKEFIDRFFEFMLDKKYVLLKSAGKTMKELSLSSDIDLLVTDQTMCSVLLWIKDFSRIQKCISIRKSFMTTVQIYFMDSSFLSIDMLSNFHRKSISYLNPLPLLGRSYLHQGIKILRPEDDYLYIYIFYLINYSAVPEKYSACFAGLTRSDENSLLLAISHEFGIHLHSLSETFVYNGQARKQVMKFIGSRKENNWFRQISRFAIYVLGQCSSLFRHPGFMLTFSGVDGAGKTTILQEIKDLLETKYRRKVVVIRHRPSILPILSVWKYGKAEADRRCIENLPRKGKNSGALSSLFRFGYYYADYIFGQVAIYFRYTIRGWVVLYDRYYFDFIVDSRRSNLSMNKSFVKGLFRFVYKPQLNIFLYAKPDVILERKKELSAEDILELTGGYKKLFEELGTEEKYLCIENVNKIETIDRIEKAFVHIR